MLTSSSEKIDQAVANITSKLSSTREEMEKLKVDLYARFGKSINLEA